MGVHNLNVVKKLLLTSRKQIDSYFIELCGKESDGFYWKYFCWLPDVPPVVAFTFWAYKFRVIFSFGQLHRCEKFELTVLTVVHINDCISSPLHT
jgi:hypothetical protein